MATKVFARANTALITGGASGVGYAVAHLCLKHGMKVAIVDNNAANLAKAKTELKSADVETYSVDVSKLEQWTELKSKVDKQLGGRIDLLMLNAGVSGKADWGDAAYFRTVLDTNLYGVINGLTTFVPVMQAQSQDKPSAIVITGSKQGITNPPGNPAYNASKAAVKTLAEHLSYDLRDTPTSVHLLVPGWTYTGLTRAAGANEKPAGAWWPSQVAEFLYEKMAKGSFYAICPDNDVDEKTDKKRMMWAQGDIVFDRQPCSRWRSEYKEENAKWMKENEF
ncbi:short chain dehydrogenase/reductase [Pseudovirgaria hyperparasitica]|uniref:Short chain dehydrogenase/reductase n=1 Tax=Pseudovirgaria hyperparasitica TaxID=470096 RepID=A0A6A6WCX6_9PEZI|nr:short chain dehydrogenase/reductase [Pseudovirgaria hyperparasitica]KAF2760425.1 short chain dehydrogenase/reductase [Pseudovirgaria hyperparasitica]